MTPRAPRRLLARPKLPKASTLLASSSRHEHRRAFTFIQPHTCHPRASRTDGSPAGPQMQSAAHTVKGPSAFHVRLLSQGPTYIYPVLPVPL
ncbi:hypothetical protein PMIN04_002338 [Paraphaeosphaeria minitans]|uniref:Uncharacterized protein n=1 Tax=Paraphaeosphaeria minitans TaxID=565426 RepID=A0A9P6GLI3_9PLEO|nr:hypothetical protein PMIN01_03130 [Paraphaeosphaeria minitans]